MNQLSFADTEFTSKRRKTRKELFLGRMNELIPWQQLEAQIDPFYPNAGNGRRPYPLATMLRIHFMESDQGKALRTKLIDIYGESHRVLLDADKLIRFQSFKQKNKKD